jgi:hypothetical protein
LGLEEIEFGQSELVLDAASPDVFANLVRLSMTNVKLTADLSFTPLPVALTSCSAELALTITNKSAVGEPACLFSGIHVLSSSPSLALRLDYDTFRVGEPSARSSILDSVERNPSIQRFVAHFELAQSFDMNQFRVNVTAFVPRNSTLEHFGVVPRGRRDAVGPVVLGLRSNRHLRAVIFACPARVELYGHGCPQDAPVRVDEQVSGDIVSMLRDCNTTLEEIEGLQYESGEHAALIDSLLELNRHGETIRTNAHRVPIEVWGDVLCRIGTDDCNFFVTELARRAVTPPRREVSASRRLLLTLRRAVYGPHADIESSPLRQRLSGTKRPWA